MIDGRIGGRWWRNKLPCSEADQDTVQKRQRSEIARRKEKSVTVCV
jgi:hypothetical protein